MRLFLVLCAVLALPAVALAAGPPTATTGAASAVTRSTATLNGTVDPNGASTGYHFEYGTTTAYGLSSAGGDAGSGDDAAPVSAALEGLSPGTTYHYRLIATNADGGAEGADRTFRTAAGPRLAAISSTVAREVGPTSASLRSRIDPNGGKTTYHFEYGLSQSYGSRTPDRDAGAGDTRVNVAEAIGGLQPYRRYHFRVVATNEAGRSASTNRTFTPSRLPTAVSLSLAAPRVDFGGDLDVFGRVSGAGVSGIQVALERQDFPFAGPFSSTGAPAPIKADRSGAFRFYIPALFSATRLRALTRSAVVATSPTVTAQVGLRVGIATRRATRRAVRIRGSVLPAAPSGRAVLQRLTRGGSWVFVRGGNLRALGERRSRFGFKVRKRRGAQIYRVRVIARDGGAHVPGTSRTVGVGPLKSR